MKNNNENMTTEEKVVPDVNKTTKSNEGETQPCKNCGIKDEKIMSLEQTIKSGKERFEIKTTRLEKQIKDLERIKGENENALDERDKIILGYKDKELELKFEEQYKAAGGKPELKEYFRRLVGKEYTDEDWIKAANDFPDMFEHKKEPIATVTTSQTMVSNPEKDNSDSGDDSGGLTWSY